MAELMLQVAINNSFVSELLLVFFCLSGHFWLSCNPEPILALLTHTVSSSALLFSSDNDKATITWHEQFFSFFPLRPDLSWVPGFFRWGKAADMCTWRLTPFSAEFGMSWAILLRPHAFEACTRTSLHFPSLVYFLHFVGGH